MHDGRTMYARIMRAQDVYPRKKYPLWGIFGRIMRVRIKKIPPMGVFSGWLRQKNTPYGGILRAGWAVGSEKIPPMGLILSPPPPGGGGILEMEVDFEVLVGHDGFKFIHLNLNLPI